MLSCFCKEWRNFLLALGFFTRIPVPGVANFQGSDLNHSAKYFPLVGIVVGAIGAGVFVLAAKIFPGNIAVLTSMVATICLTGAFHEDGLSDSVDGLGGGWDRERILAIMQDSRLGTYGAVALFFILFAKYQVLNALPMQFVAYVLIAAHAFSRLCAVYVIANLSYVKASGKAKPLATQMQAKDLMIATLFGLSPLALLYMNFSSFVLNAYDLLILSISCLTPVLLAWFWWRNKIKRWLGGYTGDCLGAMQQITELAFYLGFLAYFGFVG